MFDSKEHRTCAIMHTVWSIPELLCQIISLLPANDISRSFAISRRFRAILTANLAPQYRPLPDPPHIATPRADTHIPQDVRIKAKAYIDREVATPKQLKMEDAYYYWCEYARCQVLHALTPYLHPLFSKHETRLVDGYESLLEGRMSICLQTDIRYHDLYALVHDEMRDDRGMGDLLAVVSPKCVTVFCVAGVSWDLLYANVKYRDYGGLKRFSVSVEREEGVRLGDVVDELKGTLVVDGMSEGLGQDVSLVWVFDDGCEE